MLKGHFSELRHKNNQNFLLINPIELISSLPVQFLSALLKDIKHGYVWLGNGHSQNGHKSHFMAIVAILDMAIFNANMALIGIP